MTALHSNSDTQPAPGNHRVAAVIGGTVTDSACLSPTGELTTRKVPSTPEDYATAIVDGLDHIAAGLGLKGRDFAPRLFFKVFSRSDFYWMANFDR